MEPIPIQPVPKTSFNKHRRVSDLLLSQLKHFQHVAHKQGIEVDAALPREIYTEGGAARYITAVTRAVRERGLAMQKGTVASGPQLIKQPGFKASSADRTSGLAIAASEETNSQTKKASKTKKSVKKANKKASKK
jgi:hypothetical protein